ncbi:GLUG motif-containing protein [Methanomethylovorans sp.]|uniref:GLUG motif-containing protein n=1 Tax=Methanomethylovorans sp. TaxID=2758717 RepID=UPI00351C90EA
MLLIALILSLVMPASAFAGGDGSVNNPYKISNVYELQAIASDLDAHYVLINNIDASETASWNNGAGFKPIGTYYNLPFKGTFNGQGYEISNLYINRPRSNGAGLFVCTLEASITDVGLVNVSIQGDWMVGALVGHDGDWKTGSRGSSITNCYSTGSVTGDVAVGGLVGVQFSSSSPSIANSYSTCKVNGNANVGGLIAQNSGAIINSYSTGDVNGIKQMVGGLVGSNSGTIINSYSTGDVSGHDIVGGLVGVNDFGGTITNSYSTGYATGEESVGGLVGYFSRAVTNSYWDIETSGQSSSVGGEGRTTKEMTYLPADNTYVGWDFETIWSIDKKINGGYPYLQSLSETVPHDDNGNHGDSNNGNHGDSNNGNHGNNKEIPEFPTIALPVVAILGLAFMFQRGKE